MGAVGSERRVLVSRSFGINLQRMNVHQSSGESELRRFVSSWITIKNNQQTTWFKRLDLHIVVSLKNNFVASLCQTFFDSCWNEMQVQFIKLFSETKDGSQSHFIEMLRKQILEEQVANAPSP